MRFVAVRVVRNLSAAVRSPTVLEVGVRPPILTSHNIPEPTDRIYRACLSETSYRFFTEPNKPNWGIECEILFRETSPQQL